VALEYGRVLSAAAAALDRLHLPYHYVDSELPADRLAGYRLLVVPSFAFMDRGLLERLTQFVAQGGRLLLAPEIPRLDGAMEPLTAALPEHAQVGTDPALLEKALIKEAERLGLASDIRTTTEGLDLALYYDQGDRPQVLFVANRTDEPREGAIEGLSPDLGARDALGGQPVDLGRLHLEPFEVRMLRLGNSGEGS